MNFERPLEQRVVGIWDFGREDIFQVGVMVNGHTELLPVLWNSRWVGVVEHDGVDSWI